MKQLVFYVTILFFGTAPFLFAANPVPFVDQPLVPAKVSPGAPPFTLTVNGAGFVPTSVVRWNGASLPTTFVSGATLTAAVSRSIISTAGVASVTVLSPQPGGGASNVAFFEVTRATPTAILFGNRIATPVTTDSIVSGDFNGDGKLDIAAACGSDICILLGNGDGSFVVSSFATTAQYVGTLSAGDFNGDGRLDLAFGDPATNLVHVLLGNGDGTFKDVSSTPVGNDPVFAVAGDFDGDGKLDLAVINQSDNNVSILLGNGDGTFSLKGTVKVGSFPNSAAVGDFNRDGNLDLAVVNSHGNKVSILLGNGDGSFIQKSPVATGDSPDAIVASDFNHDGILDLAVTNYCGNDSSCKSSGSVSVLLGAGDGTFRQSSILLKNYHRPHSIAAGDFNADGNIDLVVGGVTETMGLVLMGDGKGRFRWPPVLGPTNATGETVAIGDFNGDGRLDFAANNSFAVDNDLSVTFAWQSPVAFYPAVLTFPPQLVGTTSSPKTVRFSNVGILPITISSVGVSGYFAGTNDCPSTLAVGSSCTVTLTFTPGFVGLTGGFVVVTDDALGIVQTTSLQGRGD